MEKHFSIGPVKEIRPKALFYGLISAFLCILILTMIFTSFIYFFNVSEFYLQPASLVISVLSLFLGGYIASHTAGQRGLIHGILLAILFFLLSYLIGMIAPWGSMQSILKIASCALASCLGGICGVK